MGDVGPIPYHIPTAFKVGDRVKITQTVRKAYAWYAEWTDEMTNRIGKTFYVISVDAIAGFNCSDLRNANAGWHFPSPALELVAEEVCIVEVPSISA